MTRSRKTKLVWTVGVVCFLLFWNAVLTFELLPGCNFQLSDGSERWVECPAKGHTLDQILMQSRPLTESGEVRLVRTTRFPWWSVWQWGGGWRDPMWAIEYMPPEQVP